MNGYWGEREEWGFAWSMGCPGEDWSVTPASPRPSRSECCVCGWWDGTAAPAQGGQGQAWRLAAEHAPCHSLRSSCRIPAADGHPGKHWQPKQRVGRCSMWGQRKGASTEPARRHENGKDEQEVSGERESWFARAAICVAGDISWWSCYFKQVMGREEAEREQSWKSAFHLNCLYLLIIPSRPAPVNVTHRAFGRMMVVVCSKSREGLRQVLVSSLCFLERFFYHVKRLCCTFILI